MRLATKAERKAALRRVIAHEARVQTYRVLVKLECGHTASFAISGARWHAGERGPKSVQCYECLKKSLETA
jgi:hypothetical protein